MTQVNEQLVRQITQQVMEAIGRSQPRTPAAIHPPAGVCTGDYSKFTELAGKPVGAPPAADASATAAPAPASAPAPAAAAKPAEKPAQNAPSASPLPVLFGIITAKQLEKATAGSVIRLASNARLTPLATDLVKDRKLVVERIDLRTGQPAGSGASSGTAGSSAPVSNEWVFWVDGHCPVTEAVMQEHKSTFAPLPARRQNSALAEAVRQLSNRIRDHKAAGGVLFVHSAAQATCFANRCPNLRAIVGTSDLSVEQGVKLLGANVMIVEYPMHGPRSMRGLIDRFTQTQRKPLPQVEQQLRELGTCV